MRRLFTWTLNRRGSVLAMCLALWAVTAAEKTFGDEDFPPAVFWCGSQDLPRDAWYVKTDGIAMQRLFSGLGAAATMGASPSGSLALSQKDLDDPFQAGFQMLVGHTFGDSPYQVEASYFWLNPLDTAAQASDPTANLFSPFSNFGRPADTTVDFASLVTIHLISRLEGGEVNLKYKLDLPAGDPTVVLFFGVRHIGLRENFDYFNTAPGTPPVTVAAHTNNNIWGPQIGGVVEYGHQDVMIRVEGRAAICNNQTDRELEANIGGVDAVHPRVSNSTTTEVADISAAVVWRPTAYITANIGYKAMWIDQLALASRNYISDVGTLTDPNAEPPLNERGTLIYHGPFAGLQLSW
jgi:hypothetical protein